MVQSVANPMKPRLNGDSPRSGEERPLIGFGREICGDLAAGLRREWLVTNGLGGYAAGTLAGVATRRYHGLLVAALTPPVGRTVLVGALVEHAEYDGREYPLSAHEYAGNVIDGHGYRHLQTFHLAWNLPVWVFALGDALLAELALRASLWDRHAKRRVVCPRSAPLCVSGKTHRGVAGDWPCEARCLNGEFVPALKPASPQDGPPSARTPRKN